MISEARIVPTTAPLAISRVSGYALVWGASPAPLTNADGKQYVEVFRKGCFANSILRSDIIATINGERIGSSAHGHLRVLEDSIGLWFEIEATAELVNAKAVKFEFVRTRAGGEKWNEDKTQRELLDVDLISIGLEA
jgi:phage head maturation protease